MADEHIGSDLMAISGLCTSVGTAVVAHTSNGARRGRSRRTCASLPGTISRRSTNWPRKGDACFLCLVNTLFIRPGALAGRSRPVLLCGEDHRAIQSGLESIGLALLPRTAVLLEQRQRLRRQWVQVSIGSFALGTSIALALIVRTPLVSSVLRSQYIPFLSASSRRQRHTFESGTNAAIHCCLFSSDELIHVRKARFDRDPDRGSDWCRRLRYYVLR
jgi:hypothetical protein